MNEDLRRMNVLQTLDELAHHDGRDKAREILDEWQDKNSVSEGSVVELGNATLYMKRPSSNLSETQYVLNLAYDSEVEAIRVYEILKTLLQQNEGDQA